jgi:16S rRNA C1402 (ribose-2'-O) methylase RsmI
MKNKASLFRYLYNRRAGDREHDALLAHYFISTRVHTRICQVRPCSKHITRNSHFVYGNDKVIVDLLAHGRVKLVRRMGPNKVSDPGCRSLQRAICPTPHEIQVARDFAHLRVLQIERANVGLD